MLAGFSVNLLNIRIASVGSLPQRIALITFLPTPRCGHYHLEIIQIKMAWPMNPSLTSEHSFLAFQYDQRLSRNPPALQHNTGTSKASSLMDATATVSLVCLSSVQTAAVGLHSPCHVANLTNPLCNIYIPPITSPLENLTHPVSVKQA